MDLNSRLTEDQQSAKANDTNHCIPKRKFISLVKLIALKSFQFARVNVEWNIFIHSVWLNNDHSIVCRRWWFKDIKMSLYFHKRLNSLPLCLSSTGIDTTCDASFPNRSISIKLYGWYHQVEMFRYSYHYAINQPTTSILCTNNGEWPTICKNTQIKISFSPHLAAFHWQKKIHSHVLRYP